MIPKKIFWMLGYNNLSLILDQERKHWLMKTDKKKQIQDKTTGEIFQSQIDNIGSDIIIESEKLPYKYDFIPEIKFNTENVEYILNVSNSAFPHSAMVNGLMFTRIISTKYPYEINGETLYKNYKIKFTNAKECIIPFGASTNSNEVYAGKWLYTTDNPIIMIMDDNGEYTLSKEFKFSDNVTNVVYYYPLSDTLQPIGITDKENNEYELEPINDDGLIGYPLFWFTSDISNIGPNITFENNMNDRNEQIFFISNEGDKTKYNAKIYTGISGTHNGTPDGTATSNYYIECSCKNGSSFNNTDNDFDVNIDNTKIFVINNTSNTRYNIIFNCNDNDSIKMSKNIPWTYVDEDTYKISMEYFDQNCINNENNSSLVSIFDVHFDESVPFVKTTSDVGFAGIHMNSSLSSDTCDKYPHDINKWNGLPDWINDNDSKVHSNLSMYAMHQTPTSSTSNPNTMQGAGLILDPGKVIKSQETFDDDGNPIIKNDEIGRVYVLSNDDIEYKNNALEEYPKPARTAARICDIPTSVMQLTGTSGLSPDPIVDKKYVRTQTSYSEADKDRLYNIISSRWVRPTALTENGNPVYQELGFNNKYAFESYIKDDGTFVNTLENVDLINHNNFRYTINLNPKVDVTKVHISNISNPGKSYKVNDMGVVVVGGYSFTYVVDEVDTDGGVVKLSLSPSDNAYINLSNFDMSDDISGISSVYGTSPTSGTGTGLKFQFYIEYEYYQSIITKKGDVFDDLFAFVREQNGLFIYQYQGNKWIKGQCISEYEISSTNKKNGGISTSESYINSIIPSVRTLPISLYNNNSDPSSIITLQTASFVNIIDKTHSPVDIKSLADDNEENDKTIVDMCKFYCDGIHIDTAYNKSVNSIKQRLQELNVMRYDSYVIWRWLNDDNINDLTFEYGIVYRSFNNTFTTDQSTLLPKTKLKCDNFVHTNANTTVVWDVEGVGVMMWIYDPLYTKKEEYFIDPNTRELHITRTDMNYSNIDIRVDSNGNIPEIIDKNGKYKFNIMTNNPMNVDNNVKSPIYQQPEMTQLSDAMVNQFMSNTDKKHMICGNWKLVFPRVQSFSIRNDKTNTKWIPMKMQTIKGTNITDIGVINDEYGNDVSVKNIVISEDSNGISLNMFNRTTGKWDKI